MRVTITRKHLQIAIFVLAGILVLIGILKLVFKFNMGEFLEANLSNAIMVAAIGIFVWNRYLFAQEKKAREEEEESKKEIEPKP